MRYGMSLIEARLRFNRTSPCWSRDEWRFDATEDAMVFGAPQSRLRQGSACVFERRDGSWGRPRRLEASDGQPGDGFGFRVALGGNALVVTAPLAGMRGAAYVYRWDGFLWIEEQKLRSSDGMPGDQFAYSLSMQDDEIIVGAPSAYKAGAAYAYRREDDRWTQTQELVVSQDAKGTEFGRHVGHLLHERTLIIGDSETDQWGRRRVVAHLFQRGAGTWHPIGTMKLGR